MASSSRRTEDTYESQNDQRLEELHSKIRTLRGVSLLIVFGWELPLTSWNAIDNDGHT
jgi:hypothetical protein